MTNNSRRQKRLQSCYKQSKRCETICRANENARKPQKARQRIIQQLEDKIKKITGKVNVEKEPKQPRKEKAITDAKEMAEDGQSQLNKKNAQIEIHQYKSKYSSKSKDKKRAASTIYAIVGTPGDGNNPRIGLQKHIQAMHRTRTVHGIHSVTRGKRQKHIQKQSSYQKMNVYCCHIKNPLVIWLFTWTLDQPQSKKYQSTKGATNILYHHAFKQLGIPEEELRKVTH